MYAHLFASMYRGTMMGRSDLLLVFPCLLAHCDAQGNVDMHPRVIASMTGIEESRVRAALDDLESEDPESRTQDSQYGGRRIVRLDEHRTWGWFIVNYKRYRQMLTTQSVRDHARDRQQRKRDKDAASRIITQDHIPVTPASRPITPASLKEKEKEKEKREPISPKPEPKEPRGPTFLEFWAVYPHHGRGKAEAAKLWAAMPEAARLKAMSAAAVYAKQVVGKEAGYVKWASGWLRLKRFEDEVEAPRPEEPPAPSKYPSVPLPVCFGDREFWPAWPRWLDEQVRAQEPVPGDWIAAALRWRRGEPQECPEDLAALAPWGKE